MAAPKTMTIQDPWFTLIAEQRKTVEGRPTRPGRWGEPGDVLEIVCGESRLVAVIEAVRHYGTLDEYLEAEWRQAAPQCATLEEARSTYLAITMDAPKRPAPPKRGRSAAKAASAAVQVFGEARVRERGGIEALELAVI